MVQYKDRAGLGSKNFLCYTIKKTNNKVKEHTWMPIAEDRIGRPKGRNKARGMRGVVSEREIP
jgi:hypothetical protein